MEIDFIDSPIPELSKNRFSVGVFFATTGKHLNECKQNNLNKL